MSRDDKPGTTTLRTVMPKDEHDALKNVMRVRLGQTIDAFVRDAIDAHLKTTTGRGIQETVAAYKRRNRYVQGELF